MNSFGLGLILSFTDNATAGINRASESFNKMSGIADNLTDTTSNTVMGLAAAGVSLNIVGDQLVQAGTSITDMFKNVITSVTSVGTEILGTRMTLDSLYKSAAGGEKAFNWAKQFAIQSPFNFKDLLPAMTMMKAVGIEVSDQISTASGETQNLLQYASDVAAVFPNMRNTYGTGVKAAMGAIKEYVSEGNAMTLKRGAGIDITQMLGEKKGTTIAAREKQIANLTEKMGIMGMTASLAGTPMQRLSNISDVFYNLMTDISDSGVFEKYSEIVAKISDYIFAIPQDELKNIAKTIGGALVSIMSPLDRVISMGIKLVDWLRNIIKTNPGMAKTLVTVTALVGVLLVGIGFALKFSGSIFLLASGLLKLGQFAKSATSLFGIMGVAVKSIFTKVLPFVALAYLVYVAWTKNLFGIRDASIKMANDISLIFSLLQDAFPDDTLSAENFETARKLGLLPFIQSVLDLKYDVGLFVDGFKKGFDSVYERINSAAKKFDGLKISVFGISASIGDLIHKFTGTKDTEEAWKRVGTVVGKVTAILFIVIPVVKAVSGVFKILSGVFNTVVTFGSTILKIVDAVKFVVFAIQYYAAIAAAAISAPVLIAIGVVAAIIALAAVIYIYRDQIAAFFTNLGSTLSTFFTTLWSNITSWWNNIITMILSNPIVQTVIQIFTTIKNVVVSYVMSFVALFVSFVSMVWTIIQGIVQVFVAVFNFVVALVTNAINIIVGIFHVLYEFIRIIIFAVILVFQTVFNFVYTSVIFPFINLVSTIFNWLVTNVFTPIGQFFKSIWQDAIAFVTPIIQGLGTAFSVISDGIVLAFTTVRDFLISAFDKISAVAKPFFDWIADKLGKVTGALNTVGSFFSNNLNNAGNFLGGVGDKMQKMVGLSTGGYVKTTGIAVLHPNEVVVNADTTKDLSNFLSSQKSGSVPVSNNFKNNSTSTGGNDYRVTFAAGSIVIQLANAADSELEKAAEQLMKIIERKQKLKAMANRNTVMKGV